MQFRLWRAAAFVSSPIHLFVSAPASTKYGLYINDLATGINKSTTVLNFADDTKIFEVCNDEHVQYFRMI